MILLAHMLFGAVTGSVIANQELAIFLALLGHYFLDLFPHIEYSINNINNKNWRKAYLDFAKVFLDFILAIIIIFLISKNQPIIYICAIVAIIPDGITIIQSIFKNNLLNFHQQMHGGAVHYLTKQKKFSLFWRIATQITAILISIILLKI